MSAKVLSMPSDSKPSKGGNNSTRSGSNTSNILLWALLILAVAAFAWSYMNYRSVKEEIAVLKDPNLASQLNQQQTEALLEKVGKLMVLPSEKNPVVATINDVETLASTQDFYTPANNGDKLIIFQTARKAIIFDEDGNKIVNVGPIFFSDQATAVPTTEADRLTIELRNGTATSGTTVGIRDRLMANYSFNVTRLGKAANTSYTGYTLVDTTNGAKPELVQALQQELGARVTTELPEGEAAARAEIVILIGS